MESEAQPVRKCDECGWLAFRPRSERTEISYLAEADDRMRNPDLRQFPNAIYDTKPVCFNRVTEFQQDIVALGDRPSLDSYSAVIHRERHCDAFTEWQQGFTPKEHREMVDRDRITEREDKRDQAQREWQECMATKARNWQEKEGRRRLRWEIVVFGIIATIILAASQVAAAFIDRDSIVVESPSVIVQPAEVNVQPPDVIVEPNIIINIPSTSDIQGSRP